MFENFNIIFNLADINYHMKHVTKKLPIPFDMDCGVCKRIKNLAESVPTLQEDLPPKQWRKYNRSGKYSKKK